MSVGVNVFLVGLGHGLRGADTANARWGGVGSLGVGRGGREGGDGRGDAGDRRVAGAPARGGRSGGFGIVNEEGGEGDGEVDVLLSRHLDNISSLLMGGYLRMGWGWLRDGGGRVEGER